MKTNKYELLSPAGDLKRAYYALEYGADAVYIGAKQYSLRARASNFEFEDIKQLVKLAHNKKKKVYLVINVFCRNHMISGFKKFMDNVSNFGIDGFISADPFIIKTLKDDYPNCEIHISTQQSITNSKAALFWKQFNATRVVLERSLNLDEITAICTSLKNKMEVELFVHGAVCISYSGRCMMSNNYSLRDANVGGCAQSCRWKYKVLDNTNNNYFTMSSKDMSYIKYLDKLLNLNIASFKIEGRMKSASYVTTVVRTYREYIDDYLNNNLKQQEYYAQKLSDVANREIDDGYLIDANQNKMLYHDIQKKVKQNFVFVIDKKIDGYAYEVTFKNHYHIDDITEVMTPSSNVKIKIKNIYNLKLQQETNFIKTPMTKAIIYLDQSYDFNEFCIGRTKIK